MRVSSIAILLVAVISFFSGCKVEKKALPAVNPSAKKENSHTVKKIDPGKKEDNQKKVNGDNNLGNSKSFGVSTKKDDGTASGVYSGTYVVLIRGFTGVLTLRKTEKGYVGTIYYKQWGKGVPIPLRKLRINGNKIYFERSVTNREELLKYGGSRYFIQKYSGYFSRDKSRIRGSFTDSGTDYSWEARRN